MDQQLEPKQVATLLNHSNLRIQKTFASVKIVLSIYQIIKTSQHFRYFEMKPKNAYFRAFFSPMKDKK